MSPGRQEYIQFLLNLTASADAFKKNSNHLRVERFRPSNSHFEKIFLCVIVQHVENICKGSRRRFLLRCNPYFFHRSLNTPTPVELYLSPDLPATCPQCFATRGRRVARRSGEAGGRERRSLQLRLPSEAVPSEIERKKHFTGQAGDEL